MSSTKQLIVARSSETLPPYPMSQRRLRIRKSFIDDGTSRHGGSRTVQEELNFERGRIETWVATMKELQQDPQFNRLGTLRLILPSCCPTLMGPLEKAFLDMVATRLINHQRLTSVILEYHSHAAYNDDEIKASPIRSRRFKKQKQTFTLSPTMAFGLAQLLERNEMIGQVQLLGVLPFPRCYLQKEHLYLRRAMQTSSTNFHYL